MHRVGTVLFREALDLSCPLVCSLLETRFGKRREWRVDRDLPLFSRLIDEVAFRLRVKPFLERPVRNRLRRVPINR